VSRIIRPVETGISESYQASWTIMEGFGTTTIRPNIPRESHWQQIIPNTDGLC